MNRYPSTLTGLLLVAATAYAAPSVSAELEEIIVTAQKREESLLDAALSVRAIDGESIREDDLSSLEELSSHVPGLNINAGASQPNLFVRGVGSGLNAGFEQSVGIFVDDIYLSRPQFVRAPLGMDVAGVEFIYGPQGSILGKNTVAGALNVRSAQPTDELEGYVTVLYEPDQNERSINAAISGPLTDQITGRVAVRHHTLDGWWDNETLSEEGPELTNDYVRGMLEWDSDDGLNVQARFDYGDLETLNSPVIVYRSEAATNFQGDVPFPVISDGESGADDLATSDNTQTQIGSLRITKDFEGFVLRAITGYAAYDSERVEGVDFSPLPALHRTKDEYFSQWSQEFRLSSDTDSALQWITGIYYHEQSLEAVRLTTETDFLLLGDLSIPALIEPGDAFTESFFDQDSESISAFIHFDYDFAEIWTASAGTRYSKDTKNAVKRQTSVGGMARLVTDTFNMPERLVFTNADNVLIDELRSHDFPDLHRDEDDVSWNLSLRRQEGGLTLYGSVNTAFKGGGFDEAYGNADGFVQRANPLTGELQGGPVPTGITDETINYDPEEVLAFEVGAKWLFNDSQSELFVAIFRSEYDHLQTSALDVDQFVVVNAGSAVTQGIELGGRWAITDNWYLKGGATILDANWDSFENAPCTVQQTITPAQFPGCNDAQGVQITEASQAVGQDISDQTLLFAPDISANLSLGYITRITDDLGFFSRLAIKHRDEYYSSLDLDLNTIHDALTTMDMTMGIASISDGWRLSLIGKNITDERATVVNGDVPTTASLSYFGIPTRPRSVALQLSYDFY